MRPPLPATAYSGVQARAERERHERTRPDPEQGLLGEGRGDASAELGRDGT
jgi:hypothetical protein